MGQQNGPLGSSGLLGEDALQLWGDGNDVPRRSGFLLLNLQTLVEQPGAFFRTGQSIVLHVAHSLHRLALTEHSQGNPARYYEYYIQHKKGSH